MTMADTPRISDALEFIRRDTNGHGADDHEWGTEPSPDHDGDDNGVDGDNPDAPRPFERVDLSGLMRAGITEPRMAAGTNWLYAGRLTALQSEPGYGKTWVALWLAIQIMNAGLNVIYLDEEGGPELITERLLALGADPAVIGRHLHYYPFPTRTWGLDDLIEFAKTLEAAQPVDLAVFDSLPDFLALAGKSEDSAQDVTWWINRVCGMCRDADCAQLVLDHLVKPSDDKQKRSKSRYSRGSGAKLAKADATLLVDQGAEFDANNSGHLKVWKTKDRRGRLSLPGIHNNPVILDVAVDDGTVTISARDPEPAAADGGPASGRFRPTHLMEAVSKAIEALNETGVKVSTNRAIEGVQGRRQHKIEALAVLLEEGHVEREAGPNNSVLHRVVKPYREVSDARSEGFMRPPEGSSDSPPEGEDDPDTPYEQEVF